MPGYAGRCRPTVDRTSQQQRLEMRDIPRVLLPMSATKNLRSSFPALESCFCVTYAPSLVSESIRRSLAAEAPQVKKRWVRKVRTGGRTGGCHRAVEILMLAFVLKKQNGNTINNTLRL